MSELVAGYCPMGCGQTLFVGAGGHITCSFLECPNPGAVGQILSKPETEHRVTFTDVHFTVTHPLREHLGDVAECELHQWIATLGGPPVKPGTYRATFGFAGWRFFSIPAAT